MVWEILDHQRQFQDLTFEPLILRIDLSGYVPNEIPRDVNYAARLRQVLGSTCSFTTIR